MKYRPEIDGLRSLALLPVILYHAGFQTFGGGYVGVDIFFVISGYLITSIILAEKQSGTFTLRDFYSRRARRILPALYFILFVSSIICLFMLSPSDGRDFWQSLSATILFASNILFSIKSSDYFALAAEYKPLLHTWSLAVEEQFYVIYPLILLAGWKLGRKKILVFLALMAVASLFFAQWMAYNNPAAGFFLLPTRGWELLLGAFIAFHFHTTQLSSTHILQNKTLREVGGAVGLVMIGSAVLLLNKSTPFPSLFALLPTLGTALIILFANSQTLVGKLLANKFFVGIGLISYSAYLWHQPLFSFARYYVLSDLSMLQSMMVIAITFVLAALSWKFIEQPCRKRSAISNKVLFSILAVVSLILFSIGVAGHISRGFQNIKLSLLPDHKKAVFVDFASALGQKQKVWMEISKRNPANFSAGPQRKILILGDSMSGDFLIALTLNEKLQKGNEFIRQDLPAHYMGAFLDYLGSVENTTSAAHKPLQDFNHLKRLMTDSDEIVLAANWTKATIPSALMLADFFARNNKQVYVVDAPKIFHMSASSFYFANSTLPLRELNHFMYKRLSADYLQVRNHLKDYFQHPENLKIKLIDKTDFFCNFDQETCILYSNDGLPFFFDELHLTIEGEKYFGTQLETARYFVR
jgi:peptidoglycan/LPS O-acetylase OafA/YrhL